jgi:hypothetical protein
VAWRGEHGRLAGLAAENGYRLQLVQTDDDDPCADDLLTGKWGIVVMKLELRHLNPPGAIRRAGQACLPIVG